MRLVERAVAVVNTGLAEGMPNLLLEAWARGIPVLTYEFDPDGRIAREGLGVSAEGSPERFRDGARSGRDATIAQTSPPEGICAGVEGPARPPGPAEVCDHQTGRIVWVRPGRDAATLQAFFDELGPRRASIRAISIDMNGGYEKAIRQAVADHEDFDPEVCFDAFHVVQLAGRAVDEVRPH